MFDQDVLRGSVKGGGVSHCVCSRTLCMYKKINKKTLMLYINSNYCVIRSCLNTSHTVNHSTPQQSSEAGTLDPTGWKKTQRRRRIKKLAQSLPLAGGKTGLCLQVAGAADASVPNHSLSRTAKKGGWDCPNQRRSDYCKLISCKGQLIPPPPHEGVKKRSEGVKEEYQTLQTLVYEENKKIKP